MTSSERDALTAAVELVGRAGAHSCEIGYIDEPDGATWWAHAQYRGTRLIVQSHPTPIAAAEALAARILDGAQCRRCGQPIRLDDGPGCRWTRTDAHWEPGCGQPIDKTIPLLPEMRAER